MAATRLSPFHLTGTKANNLPSHCGFQTGRSSPSVPCTLLAVAPAGGLPRGTVMSSNNFVRIAFLLAAILVINRVYSRYRALKDEPKQQSAVQPVKHLSDRLTGMNYD